MENQKNEFPSPEDEALRWEEAANIRESLELVRRAEAALEKMQAILIEMRGLADRAAHEKTADRAALNHRFQLLKGELAEAVGEADYGGFNLLDGSLGNFEDALATIEQALGIEGDA